MHVPNAFFELGMLGNRMFVTRGKEFSMQSRPETTDHNRSEADLIVSAQGGDPDAFAALFNAHKARVYSMCLRMTRNAAEAEDLTQEVFLHVFRKLAAFRRDAAFSTWLYRVTVNTVLMHLRKKKVCHLSLDERVTQVSGSQLREYGRVDHNLRAAVDRIAATRAIMGLPAGYRTVFVLHEVKGYEHHDIAQMLRCSIGTSKSQLHKAKARIRELLSTVKPPRLKQTPGVTPSSVATPGWRSLRRFGVWIGKKPGQVEAA